MIHRLMLGAANFGLDDYPPAKGHQRVPRDEAVAIIRHAYACGIRAFDTAAAYGNAEEILAEALEDRPAHVTTKCSPESFRRHPAWITLLHNPTVAQMNPEADGASVYTDGEALASFVVGCQHLQAPYWLMDPSFGWVLAHAKASGVTTYARQPYGRGQVPCKEALWFSLASPADYIVFGARNIKQLDDTLRWAEMPAPEHLLPSVCTRR